MAAHVYLNNDIMHIRLVSKYHEVAKINTHAWNMLIPIWRLLEIIPVAIKGISNSTPHEIAPNKDELKQKQNI